jgi:DNA-binding NarL/FixJ family response regulator
MKHRRRFAAERQDWIRRAKGFRCVGVYPSGERALSALPAIKPEVVLVDIALPGMNGIECVRHLNTLLSETEFIMVTTHEDAYHVLSSFAVGASGYLLKSARRPDLLASIKQAYDGGSPLAKNVARKVVQTFHRPPKNTLYPGILSQQEWKILRYLALGLDQNEIALSCLVRTSTVRKNIGEIYRKLHVHSCSQAVVAYKQSLQCHERWHKQENRNPSLEDYERKPEGTAMPRS